MARSEQACNRGDFVLSESILQRILKKYYIHEGELRFQEKCTGEYFAFKTPENKLYLVGEHHRSTRFVTNNSKNVDLKSIEKDDTTFIKTADYSGVIQFKNKLSGDYYVFENGIGKTLVLSGADIDILDSDGKAKLFPNGIP
jgi:hypothetical protein